MRDVIDQARSAVDQAELYWKRERTLTVSYENYDLESVVEQDLSSVAVRVIDRGKMGATFGVRPDQQDLLDHARRAAAFGDPASFSFSPAATYPTIEAADPTVDAMASADLVALCEATKAAVARVRPDVALFLRATASQTTIVARTTLGADAEQRTTGVGLAFGAPIRGAGIGVYKSLASTHALDVPADLVAEFDEWYGWTSQASTPRTGRLPAIFAPEASFLYLLPLWATLSGSAFVDRTSPLLKREGERVLSPLLTIVDDPTISAGPSARAFDDEGTPCRRRSLVENGVLRGILLDLRTAAALSRTSMGNGFKRALFGGGTEVAANPWPAHFAVDAGTSSLPEMIADVDEGLLVTGGLGFHSGNYGQGQFAVQALGFHVRGGRIIGRLDRTMISSDIFRDFLEVRSLSRDRRATHTSMLYGGLAPYVLVDAVQVAGA